eukprot:gene12645-13943_t
MLLIDISTAEEFEGKAKGFGFDVMASQGATALAMKPPESSIKTSGGNFEYEKVDGMLGPQPPFANQVIAMVQAKGPQMNVKGDYPKWKPKIVKMKSNKKIINVHMSRLHHIPISLRKLDKKYIKGDGGKKKSENKKRQILKSLNIVKRSTQRLNGVLNKLKPKGQDKEINERRSQRFANFISKRDIEDDIEDDDENTKKEEMELEKYASGMKRKVNHVINEAENVLSVTEKVVRGLKRVIGGAKKLTEFGNNAVKFANYFAMEPSNATVDFLEEKAVIAVLEAQKAATEAKIESLNAKEAAKSINDVLKKIKKYANKKSMLRMLKAAKFANMKAKMAEKRQRMQ